MLRVTRARSSRFSFVVFNYGKTDTKFLTTQQARWLINAPWKRPYNVACKLTHLNYKARHFYSFGSAFHPHKPDQRVILKFILRRLETIHEQPILRDLIFVNIKLFSSRSQISPSLLNTFSNYFFVMMWC